MYNSYKGFSTPAIIAILEKNNFKISNTETIVTVEDLVRRSHSSCYKSAVKITLDKNENIIYKRYSNIPLKLQTLAVNGNPIEREAAISEMNIYKGIIDKLIYFIAITECIKKLNRVGNILKSILTELELSNAIKIPE